LRLGDVHALQGRLEDAESCYQRAIAVQEQTLPPDDPRRTDFMIRLGNFYVSLGKTEEAEQAYLNVLKLRQTAFGEQHPAVIDAMLILADFYDTQHQPKKAEQFYRIALAGQELANGREDQAVGLTSILMAKFYDAKGDEFHAQQFYANGMAILANAYGLTDLASSRDIQPKPEQPTIQQTAESLYNRAAAYVKLRMYREARQTIDQSVNTYERILDPRGPEFVQIIRQHADLLRQIGDHPAAEALERRVHGTSRSVRPD
jgi:tetratricopeptide (TPR) repeat protein